MNNDVDTLVLIHSLIIVLLKRRVLALKPQTHYYMFEL